ncbi:PEP-CTERM sorting domain-containing protein [Coraliomargarita sp. W4R53]
MNTYFQLLPLITLASSLSAASFSDDFNRSSDVAATTIGSEIGTNWTFGPNTWGIDNTTTDGRVYTDIATSGEANTALWNTSVAMASTASQSSTVSIDVLGDSETNFFGMAFNVQNYNTFYQFRLKFGTNDYQVIEFNNGVNTDTVVNQSNDVASNFDPLKSYTLTLVSNVGGIAGDYSYTITESGSSTALNSISTFSDSTFTGGYAGFTHANRGAAYYYDNFTITTVPEPSTYTLLSGSIALLGCLMMRRHRNQVC